MTAPSKLAPSEAVREAISNEMAKTWLVAASRNFSALTDAALSAIAAQGLVLVPVEQWLLIETAPKDGMFVMLFCGDSGAWCPSIARWNGDGWGDELETFHLPALGNMPTHWRPLPNPPAAVKPPAEET